MDNTYYNAEGRASKSIAELEVLNHRWNRAMSQFAAGSEFHDDPERTAEVIRFSRSRMMSALRREAAERVKLRAALRSFGQHRPDCGAWTHDDPAPDADECDCGLADALSDSGEQAEHPDTMRLKKLFGFARLGINIVTVDSGASIGYEISVFDEASNRRIYVSAKDAPMAVDALPGEE